MHSGAAFANPTGGPGLLPNGNPFLQGTASQPIEEHDEGIVGNTPVNYEQILNVQNDNPQQMQLASGGDATAATPVADEELKKKIALYYHSLFQGSLAQWFVLMQQKNYTKLTKKQYLDLNVRIQKSLILDFDLQSAQDSALEDWKIDIEREQNDKKNPGAPEFQNEKKNNEPYMIEFERLSEFFFDLCLSWCQHLELELFLYFVNGVFLNITKGAHVNISEFKPLEEIEVLSIEFFNQLLQYRSKYEQEGPGTYQQWYNRNFMSQQDIVRNVEMNLQEAFKDKVTNLETGQKGETRILDLWIDMPATNPVMQGGYLQQNFIRLDKDFQVMQKASKAQDLLIQSMTLMDQTLQQRVNEKMKTRTTGFGDQTKASGAGEEQHQQLPTQTPAVNKTKKTNGLATTNTRETKQNEIERFLLGQLGDRFKHAKLLEVSEGSYLITMDVRLPVFGKALNIEKRDMKSILRDKAGYLLKRDAQKYTSQRNRNDKQQPSIINEAASKVNALNTSAIDGPLSAIDAFSDQIPSAKNIIYEKKTLPGATKIPQAPSGIAQQRKLVGDHYLAGGTLDSESDIHALQALSGIPSAGLQHHFDGQAMMQDHGQQYLRSQPLDEPTLKLVYERFLALLDTDKNATIDDVLRQEDVNRLLQTNFPQVSIQEIEQAVIERLQAEEESAEIQDMIARFYNKFDELHEQSVQAALAKSPNKLLVKNEIKYKIPERWTKPFHKHDIIGKILSNDPQYDTDQRGQVNKQGVQTMRLYQQQRQGNNDDSLQAIMQNQYIQQTLPQNQQQMVAQGQDFLRNAMVEGEGLSPNKQVYSKDLGPYQDAGFGSPYPGQQEDVGADSTDVSVREPGEYKPSGLCKPQRYDWSEVAHLFEDGVVPEELASITDPIEYNYILVRLKRDFNENHKSDYLKYMNLQLPYHSRRDEIGGAITQEEWGNFIDRLEGIIDRVQKRRKRIIRRRKKKGNKKMPRKTLFKPIQRPNMLNNPLWCEVYMNQDKNQDDDSDDGGHHDPEDGYSSTDELLEQHKKLIRGLQSAQSMKQGTATKGMNLDLAHHRVGLTSAKLPPKHQPAKGPMTSTSDFTLPPILKPLLDDQIGKKKAKRENSVTKTKKNGQGALKNKEANLRETVERFPEATSMLNMRLKEGKYKDPADQLDPHKPARTMGNEVPNNVLKLEHNYSKKVKKHYKQSAGGRLAQTTDDHQTLFDQLIAMKD